MMLTYEGINRSFCQHFHIDRQDIDESILYTDLQRLSSQYKRSINNSPVQQLANKQMTSIQVYSDGACSGNPVLVVGERLFSTQMTT